MAAKRDQHGQPNRHEGDQRDNEQRGPPPRRPPGDHLGHQEHAPHDHRHRVGERRHADRQRRPQRMVAREQGEPRHGERHRQQERVLTVGQVEDHDDGERRRRQQARHAPGTAHVEMEQQRQQTGGEHDDRRGPDQAREQVVHDAVAHGTVGAAVPEVVPDERLPACREARLVDVRRRVDAGKPDEVHEGQSDRDRDDRAHGERQQRAVDRAPRPRARCAHLGHPPHAPLSPTAWPDVAEGVADALAEGLGVVEGADPAPVDGAPPTRLNTYTPSRAKTDW